MKWKMNQWPNQATSQIIDKSDQHNQSSKPMQVKLYNNKSRIILPKVPKGRVLQALIQITKWIKWDHLPICCEEWTHLRQETRLWWRLHYREILMEANLSRFLELIKTVIISSLLKLILSVTGRNLIKWSRRNNRRVSNNSRKIMKRRNKKRQQTTMAKINSKCWMHHSGITLNKTL